MYSRPVPRGPKDITRNKLASNDRVNTHRRRYVVTRYEPYKRPDPKKVPPNLFVDRPRMLHDPNLKGEWVERAKQLLREPSLTRVEDGQIWRHPAQHPYDDPSPAFIWRSPFARHMPEYHCPPPAEPEQEEQPPSPHNGGAYTHRDHPYTRKSFCFQALLSVPPGKSMLLNEVLEYLFDRYPRLAEINRRNHNSRSHFNHTLKSLANSGLVETYVTPGGGQEFYNRWRIVEGARQQAISMAWKPKLPTTTTLGQRNPTPARASGRPRRRTC